MLLPLSMPAAATFVAAVFVARGRQKHEGKGDLGAAYLKWFQLNLHVGVFHFSIACAPKPSFFFVCAHRALQASINDIPTCRPFTTCDGDDDKALAPIKTLTTVL